MVGLRRAADLRERLEREITGRVATDRPVLLSTTGVTPETEDGDENESQDEKQSEDESGQNDQAAGVCQQKRR